MLFKECERVRPDVNLSVIFAELPLLRRPAAAAACGFDAVELWWPFTSASPSGPEIEDLVDALGEAGVSLIALNFDAGTMADGERGLVSIPGQERRFRDSVDTAVGFAEQVGCRAFNALYGNRVTGVEPQAQDDLALENLTYATEAASRIGGVVLIETQNAADSPRYPMRRLADAITVVDRVSKLAGVRNIALLADLYHLHRAGEDLAGTVTKFASRIAHVQVADDPGRHQPGTGAINFETALSALTAAGYDGYIGLEYNPLGPSADSFAWLQMERRRTRWEQEVPQ